MFRRTLLAAAFGALLAASAQAATLTVTSTADTLASDGHCTLREAIASINGGTAINPDCVNTGAAYGTGDTIAFNIPAATDAGCNAGTGVCTIAPANMFSLVVNKTVLIDGYTQPGATQNTLIGGAYPNAQGLDMRIKIELDGNALPAGGGNLRFGGSASNSEVRGLAIYGFNGDCLNFGGGGNLIDGNIIGLRADGTTIASGYQCHSGIALGNGQSNNTIGGFTPASRNLIAATSSAGILIAYSSSNVIANNLIGTDITGTQGRANSFVANTASGINLTSSSGVSATAIDSNVIADWGGAGILLVGADHTTIARNAIGIGVGGVALGNALTDASAGVAIMSYPGGPISANTTVYSNGIANNTGDGILVLGNAAGDPSGNQLDRNAIYGNGGLGINLQPVAEANNLVTANDAPASLDADSGPNGLQNFPVVTSAAANAGGVTIAYTLDSGASGFYSISAYASDTCSWTGHGEGRYLAGPPLSWMTDASGHLAQTFSYGAMPANWHVGMWVSLLATDSSGNTSEFSNCVQIAASLSPTVSAAPNPLNLGASTVGTPGIAQTETITNSGGTTLNISGVTVTGTNAADFNITANTCTGASLAPSATCTITLACTPSSVGPRAANLNIASNDPASPAVVALTATGYPPPTASPSANPLAFGNQTVATTSAGLTETITNTGIAHLSISAVSLAGVNASDFNIAANTCTGASLAPSATCTISATFTPSATGARSAALNIVSNDPASPLGIGLTGTGVAAGTAPAITSATPPGGTVGSAYGFTVTATGTAPIGFGDGGTLPPGLSINATSGAISGTPSAAGSYNVVITASNGVLPNATQSFSLVIAAAAGPVTPVPTLDGWALLALSVLLGLLGIGRRSCR